MFQAGRRVKGREIEGGSLQNVFSPSSKSGTQMPSQASLPQTAASRAQNHEVGEVGWHGPSRPVANQGSEVMIAGLDQS